MNTVIHKRDVAFRIAKADDEKHLLYGVVYEPYITDLQGDWARPDSIEVGAHKFMIKSRQVGHQHEDMLDNEDVCVVESYIAPINLYLGADFIRKGSWVMVVKVFSDPIWNKVKRGEITGFSMGGTASAVNVHETEN